MRFERLRLRAVGPFEDLELEFPPGTRDDLADVYLLVGANGSGKSSILRALASFFRADGPARARVWWTGGEIKGRFGGHDAEIIGAPQPDRYTPVVQRGGGQLFPVSANGRYSFWAYAYSGSRDLDTLRAAPMHAPEGDPTSNAANFDHRAASEDIARWIVQLDYADAVAARSGARDATSVRAPLAVAERLLSETLEARVRLTVDLRADLNGRYGVLVHVGDDAPIDVSLLPDGVKSILAWTLDLVMRLHRTPWVDDLPLAERAFLLLLDEIDVHLHPQWQRRVLPIIQRTFPRAQVVASTHSPFVVGSAWDARTYPLTIDPVTRRARLMTREELSLADSDDDPRLGLGAFAGTSYRVILTQIFGISTEFDAQTEGELSSFGKLKHEVLRGAQPLDSLQRAAKGLLDRSPEVASIVWSELKAAEARIGSKS